jgi:hypothetical protein
MKNRTFQTPSQVEETMMDSLRAIIKESNDNYAEIERHNWCLLWPGQVVLCTSCYYWTIEGEAFLRKKNIAAFEQQLKGQINKVVEMVR